MVTVTPSANTVLRPILCISKGVNKMMKVFRILFLLFLAVQPMREVSLEKTKAKGMFTNNEEGWLAFINQSEWYII
ncbi:Uncharacterised protein [Lysinibacillus sphaericus]|nr:Uncharacterised protein [Lysinibacillus sphaericus]